MVFVTTDPARDDRADAAQLPRPVRPDLRRADRRPARRSSRLGKAVRRRRSRRARSSPPAGYDVAHGTQIVGAAARRPGAVRLDRGHRPRRAGRRHHHDPRRQGARPVTAAASSRAPARASGTSARSRSAAYALCIILGVVVAIWLGERRWVARGGARGQVADIAIWAVPFGLVGGRLYHVITDPTSYFGDGRRPDRGALHLAGRPRHLGRDRARRASAPGSAAAAGLTLPPFADALAPGIVVAQAIGRWGNWFNQELYGKPTTLPWGAGDRPARTAPAPATSSTRPSTRRSCTSASGTSASPRW